MQRVQNTLRRPAGNTARHSLDPRIHGEERFVQEVRALGKKSDDQRLRLRIRLRL